jgi:hypothetical protein
MNTYIFDIEQSLTPLGTNINTEFQTFFIEWMIGKNILLVTSAEKDDTVSQIGQTMWEGCTRIYQSNANIQYRGRTTSAPRPGGINQKALSVRGDRNKSLILDDVDYYTTTHFNTCHVTYFGTDSQTIEKLENEWNTSNKTHTVHQTNTYTDTWDVLK